MKRPALFMQLLFLMSTLFIVGQPNCIADKKLKFKANKTYKISSAGISLKLPKGSQPQLQPTLTYQYRQLINEKNREIYKWRDIWNYNQHLGRWEDAHKNTVILKKVTTLIPFEMVEELSDMDRYNSEVNGHKLVDFTKAENQEKWFKIYNKDGYSSTTTIVKGSLPNVVISVLKEEAHEACYMFYQKGKKTVYFLHYILNDELDEKNSLKSIVRAVKATNFLAKGKKANTKKKRSKFQSRATAKHINKTPEFKASVARVIKEIGALSSWWYVETEDYVIASDMTKKEKKLARKVQEDITFMRNAYEQIQPQWSPFKEVSVVKVFGDRKSYVTYVGEKLEWSGGLWSASRKELIVSGSSKGTSKSFKAHSVLSTVYHEAYHQYNFYACEGTSTSVWFNEGHACFFEGSRIKSGKLTVPENRHYLRTALRAVKANDIDFPKQLFMTYEEFYGDDKEHNYAFAWSLVYYLRKYCWKNPKSPYSKLLDDYLENLKKLRDRQAANKATFEHVDMKKFKAAYMKFWSSKRLRKKAQKHKIFKSFKFKK